MFMNVYTAVFAEFCLSNIVERAEAIIKYASGLLVDTL